MAFLKFFQKKFVCAVIYAILLTAFTAYIALDTFVITRVYAVVEPESAADSENEDTAEDIEQPKVISVFTDLPVFTENSYSDQNISITITEYREYDTAIYVADIYISSAEYLKTALAKNSYGRNITEKTSKIARDNNAIIAINGDFYGARKKGFVLKNGVLYRESASKNQEDLAILNDGSFDIIIESEVSAAELLEGGTVQTLSFGPALIDDGVIAVTERDEVDHASESNPRTAIGIIDDLHYLFVVSDGRTEESEGLSLYQLAGFMQGLGAYVAYNLDGGGSSTMYFNGEVVNIPTADGKKIKERKVSDIVYIGY